jgi:RNA polymerase sigma-70 factor (ECF subfamily)
MPTPSHNRQQNSLENGVGLERIIANHSEFLSFLSNRVGEPATAEDILQSAYLKAMEHRSQLRNEESVVAWFYRILRNAIIDLHRRGAARLKAHERFGAETP